MSLLPHEWIEAMQEAQDLLLAFHMSLKEDDPGRAKITAVNGKLTEALSESGQRRTVEALVGLRQAAERAYIDLRNVGACTAGHLDRLPAELPPELAEPREHVRVGLEHIRDAAALLLGALADDEGPGKDTMDQVRYLRGLLSGLLAKEKTHFNLKDAGHELGQRIYAMRERLQLAERASMYLHWLHRVVALLDAAWPKDRPRPADMAQWVLQAGLYAQAARSYVDGKHPDRELLDHPLLRAPDCTPQPQE